MRPSNGVSLRTHVHDPEFVITKLNTSILPIQIKLYTGKYFILQYIASNKLKSDRFTSKEKSVLQEVYVL